MDYNAQKARFEEGETEETKAELRGPGKQLQRAAGSQVAQTAVFALMKIGADFLLHRWDREQDENGDVTLKILLSRFTGLFTESAAGNFLWGSELYSLIDNAIQGKDYDVISATNISAVNDLAGDVTKFVSELRKDTADMDEAKLAAHHGKVEKYALTLMEDGLEIAGVPFGNGRKILEAFKGYVQDAVNMFHGGKFTFNSLPSSATASMTGCMTPMPARARRAQRLWRSCRDGQGRRSLQAAEDPPCEVRRPGAAGGPGPGEQQRQPAPAADGRHHQ